MRLTMMLLSHLATTTPWAFVSRIPTASASVLRSSSLLSTSLLSTASSSSSSVVDSCTNDNPFLQQGSTPRFSSLKPSFLPSAVDSSLQELQEAFKRVEEGAVTGDIAPRDVLESLEVARSKLEYTWSVAGHLNGVNNSDELRTVYQDAQPKVVDAFQQLGQSKAIYDALSEIDVEALEMSERRAVEGSLRAMRLSGVGLADPTRFNEIKSRLAELSTTFTNNVLDSTKEFGLEITDKSKLNGVPDTAMAMFAANYDAENPSASEGPWKITLDAPSYIACMQHCPDRSTRETVWRGFNTRASTGKFDNVPLIEEILSLRKEMCAILEFDNFADLSLSKKMAESVDEVEEMSVMLAEKALPMAHKELQEITDLAREIGGEEYATVDKLDHWDTAFFSERLKERKFDLTDEQLRPYFSLDSALEGLFGISKKLFNIDIHESKADDAEVWNEDVRFYNVFDASTNKKIASFFLDPFSRPSNKRGGAWMDVCIAKSAALRREVPVAYLTCNGSPPAGGKPSLMTFREVETLFHEFGHGLQHMLTKESIGDVSGINGVEWDAVELPSQFMENWCYDRSTLFGMAKHYETNESLPEEIYQKLLLQRTFGSGMQTMRQLYFGQLDMELHTFPKSEKLFDTQKRIAAKYSPHLLPLESDRFLCSFSHIFGGGYAAGYYSYKWAEVMSADAFGAFEEAGLDNEEKVKDLGKLFRDTVLGLGGGQAPDVVFKKFRGRKPNSEALQRHTGLV